MTADRPVADRGPLNAEEERDLRAADDWIGFTSECGVMVRRLLATLDAARAHPDEAGLRAIRAELAGFAEPYDGGDPLYQRGKQYGLQLAIGAIDSRLSAQPAVPVAHDLPMDPLDESLARRARRKAALVQPAVPVAGAEDWYDRDAKAFARAHAQTGALRAAQPEDDGLAPGRWAFLDQETGDWIEVKPGVVHVRSSEGVERRDG